MAIQRDYSAFAYLVRSGRNGKAGQGDRGYLKDYPVLIAWFEDQEHWDKHNVRIGALMVYGWMPTILRTQKMTDFSGFARRLEEDCLCEADHRFINGSYVGTSKFLHFWKPDHYAIWDRRICKALGWGHSANSKAKFDVYQSFCRKFCSENESEGWTMRDVEQSLFLQSGLEDQ